MNNKVIKIKGEIKTSEEIIHIKNLMLKTKFGFYPKEKKISQRLIFNLKVHTIKRIIRPIIIGLAPPLPPPKNLFIID